MNEELQKISQQYERRKLGNQYRYSRFNPDIISITQERQRNLIALFKGCGITDLSDLDILEIGCGAGSNLLELILLGAAPSRLVGNELLPERVLIARNGLPQATRIFPGDASALPFGPAEFDVVYQSTVFSSILDNALQERIAQSMWHWTRAGGGILWYDFIYNNPANPDVKGMPVKRIRELFPHGDVQFRRVTLAPPISRRVCDVHPLFYPIFNSLPFLRTHVLCWVGKPKD